MTVRSSDYQDNVRNYSLRVNEKLTMEDFIRISDPWSFEQLITMKDLNIEDKENYSVKTRIQFTGHFWRQQIEWDGDVEQQTIISFDIEKGFTFQPEYSWYESPKGNLFYWQDFDIEKAIWTSTIGSQKSGMIWNTFDLNNGIWK